MSISRTSVDCEASPLWLDFDCGGLGWRVYDVATFYWALKLKWVGWSVEYADSDDAINKRARHAYPFDCVASGGRYIYFFLIE
jgi:hypothetical protein